MSFSVRTRWVIAILLLVAGSNANAQYAPGTVFVSRIGTGTTGNSGAGTNSVNIVPYQFSSSSWSAGTPLVASTTGATALTVSGSATSEGALSINGSYLGIAGYRTGTAGDATNRVIGQVDVTTGSFSGTAANIDSSTALPSAVFGSAIRSAVWTSDGSRFYAAGDAGQIANRGVHTNTFGTTSGSTQLYTVTSSNDNGNTRVVGIVNNQLYVSSGAGSIRGFNSIGTGVPATSGQTITTFPNTTSGSPYGFALSPDSLTLYLADDRSSASGGGIQKYTRSNTSSDFTLSTTFGTGSGSTVGARGLSVDFSGPNPVLYAVTSEGSSNRLITFSDVAGVQTDFTVIATAVSGEIFRGVAVIPVPEPGAILALSCLGLGIASRIRRQRRQLAL